MNPYLYTHCFLCHPKGFKMPLEEVKKTTECLTDFPPFFIFLIALKLGVKEMEDR